MPRTQSETEVLVKGGGPAGQRWSGTILGWGQGRWLVSLLGASSILADAKVRVGDGAHDGLVYLAFQAPLTGTLVVNPIECLQRRGARGVTGCWGLLWASPALGLTPGTSGQSVFSDGASPAPTGCLPQGARGPGGLRFWLPLWLICSF